jgi:hypothetical protein
VTPKPKLIISKMNRFQGFVLRIVARCLGIRGDAYVCLLVVEDEFPDDYIAVFDKNEPTINDIAKNNEENEANKPKEKESGE